ncbi:MAG: TetR/AcrR family transcriptional regulator [Pyrinomonadaceae bacterium]
MSSKISETRKNILETASRLLLESKGQGVRMADIARAAGVSRQAVYLHFPSRGELMISAVRYLDNVYGLDERVKQFREAKTGIEILEAFVDFWGNYIPEIYGVAKALMLSRETDDAAAAAWNDRMNSIRSGCRRTIETIEHEGLLSSNWSIDQAVDLMWTMLSIENWERLTAECGWTHSQYVERMQLALNNVLIGER